MTITVSQVVNGSLDTAVNGTSMNALTNGSYALGSAINNVPSAGTTVSYDMADLVLVLSSGVTTGANAANLTVWILPAVDGTNYPTPPGGSAGAGPSALSYVFQFVPSTASSSVFVCPNIPIPPYNFKVMIQNNLGVTFPATNTSTCQIQRKTLANW